MNRPLVSALATIALVALSQSATAEAPFSMRARQITLSFGDLNVHSEVGAGVLLNRLRVAARIVCGPEPMFLDLSGRHYYDACRKSALDDAVAAIGSSKLNEAYRGNLDYTRTAQN